MTEKLRKDAKKIKRFKKSSVVFPIVGGVILAGGAAVGITYGLMNLPIISAETGEAIVDPLTKRAEFKFDFKESIPTGQVEATILAHGNSNAEGDPTITFTDGSTKTLLPVSQGVSTAPLRLDNAPLTKGIYIYKFDMNFVYTNASGKKVNKTIKNLDLKYTIDNDTLDITDPSVTEETVIIDEHDNGSTVNGFTFSYKGEIADPHQVTVRLNEGFVVPSGTTVEPYIDYDTFDTEKQTFVVKFNLKNVKPIDQTARRTINGPVDIYYNLNLIHTVPMLTLNTVQDDFLYETTIFKERVIRKYFVGEDIGHADFYAAFTGFGYRGEWMDKIKTDGKGNKIAETTFPKSSDYEITAEVEDTGWFRKQDKIFEVILHLHINGDAEQITKFQERANLGMALEGGFVFKDANDNVLFTSAQTYHYTLGDTKDPYIAIADNGQYFGDIVPDGFGGGTVTIRNKWWYLGLDTTAGGLNIEDAYLDSECYTRDPRLEYPGRLTVEIDRDSINPTEKSFETVTTWYLENPSVYFNPEGTFKGGEISLAINKFKFEGTSKTVEPVMSLNDLSFQAHWKNNIQTPRERLSSSYKRTDSVGSIDITTNVPVQGFDSAHVREWLHITVEQYQCSNIQSVQRDVDFTYKPVADNYSTGVLTLTIHAITGPDKYNPSSFGCSLNFDYRPEDSRVQQQSWQFKPDVCPLIENIEPLPQPSIDDKNVTKKPANPIEFDTQNKCWTCTVPVANGFTYKNYDETVIKDKLGANMHKPQMEPKVSLSYDLTPTDIGNGKFGLVIKIYPQETITQAVKIAFDVEFTVPETVPQYSQGWEFTLAQPPVVITVDDKGVTKATTDLFAKPYTGTTYTKTYRFSGYSVTSDKVKWDSTNIGVDSITIDSSIKASLAEVGTDGTGNNYLDIKLEIPQDKLPKQLKDNTEIKFDLNITCKGGTPLASQGYVCNLIWDDMSEKLQYGDIDDSAKKIEITAPKAQGYQWTPTFSGYSITLDSKPANEYWDEKALFTADIYCEDSGMQKNKVQLLRDGESNNITLSVTLDVPQLAGESNTYNFSILIYFNKGSNPVATFTSYQVKVTAQ